MSNLYQGILPHLIYPSTVADEQARLLAALKGTDASVQACTAFDAPTKQAWALFLGAAGGFCAETPGWFGLGTMMDRAQKYEDELVAWQTKLNDTCKLSLPTYTPPDAPSEVSNALQSIVWIVGAAAGAYVVGQVISVIPKKR